MSRAIDQTEIDGFGHLALVLGHLRGVDAEQGGGGQDMQILACLVGREHRPL